MLTRMTRHHPEFPHQEMTTQIHQPQTRVDTSKPSPHDTLLTPTARWLMRLLIALGGLLLVVHHKPLGYINPLWYLFDAAISGLVLLGMDRVPYPMHGRLQLISFLIVVGISTACVQIQPYEYSLYPDVARAATVSWLALASWLIMAPPRFAVGKQESMAVISRKALVLWKEELYNALLVERQDLEPMKEYLLFTGEKKPLLTTPQGEARVHQLYRWESEAEEFKGQVPDFTVIINRINPAGQPV